LGKSKDRVDPNKPKTLTFTNLNINPQIVEFLLEEDDGEQMYFKEPSQIVNIFLNLEESNLFLMTNLKTIEQSTEVFRNNFTQKRKILDTKNAELLSQKVELMKQIAQVEKEIDHIRVSTNRGKLDGIETTSASSTTPYKQISFGCIASLARKSSTIRKVFRDSNFSRKSRRGWSTRSKPSTKLAKKTLQRCSSCNGSASTSSDKRRN